MLEEGHGKTGQDSGERGDDRVCARGHDRGVLFCCDEDREHFLGLLKEARERFCFRW